MNQARYTSLDEVERKTSSEFTPDEREGFLLKHVKPISTSRWSKKRIFIASCLLISIISLIGAFNYDSYLEKFSSRGQVKIAKVSMLYGNKNDLFERALQTHIRHGEKWGYPTWIARRDAYCGYWNKPTFVISKVAQELAKPEGERMDWLMWVDADSIVLNPNVPMHIFLPPKEFSHINFVGTRDIQGLNSGVFFVRVHPWTISMLVDSMAFPLCHADIDLGNDADQAAMARTFEKTDGGHEGDGFKDGVVYLPRHFFNTFELPGYLRVEHDDLLRNFSGFKSSHGYEGKKGDFIVHLPGLFDDRAPFMADWLDLIENRQDEWAIPLEDTKYVEDAAAFWDLYGMAKDTLEEASKKEPMTTALEEEMKKLKLALSEEADDSNMIKGYTAAVRELLST